MKQMLLLNANLKAISDALNSINALQVMLPNQITVTYGKLYASDLYLFHLH